MASLQDTLNKCDPNTLADQLRAMKIGDDLLTGHKRTLRAQVPVVATGVVALPNTCKARRIIGGWARTGTGTLGNLAPSAFSATPADGELGITATGDLIINIAAVTYTSFDAEYEPIDGDVVTITLPVAANVATIPTRFGPLVQVISCTGTVGTTLGAKVILFPGAGGPAATQCRPNLALTTLTFNAGDALTEISVTFIKSRAVERGSVLLADSQSV
jgi:hypothetical protein